MPTAINPSMPTLDSVQISAVTTYLMAMAHYELLLETAKPFRDQALKEIAPVILQEFWKDPQKPERATAWEEQALITKDERQKLIMRFNALAPQNIHIKDGGVCPISSAKMLLRDAGTAVVILFSDITGKEITPTMLLQTGKYEKYLDLCVTLGVKIGKITTADCLVGCHKPSKSG